MQHEHRRFPNVFNVRQCASFSRIFYGLIVRIHNDELFYNKNPRRRRSKRKRVFYKHSESRMNI